MNAPTATADTLLRQAWLRVHCSQAGRFAPRDFDMLVQVCLGPSAFRMPVSRRILVVSSRTPHE